MNTFGRACVVVAGLLALSSGGVAQDEKIDCRDGGATPYEMNMCAARAADAAEATLAKLSKELEAKLDVPARDEFREIHAQWRTLRDRDCMWQRGLFAGGSVAPLMFASCKEARTKERIARLRLLLCDGFGMTAPCEASRKY